MSSFTPSSGRDSEAAAQMADHAFVRQPGTGMNICGVKGCALTIAQHLEPSAASVDYSEMFLAASALREWLLSEDRPYYALVVAALIDLAKEAVDAAK